MDQLKDKFEFRVRWEPFLLRPSTPPEGAPSPKYSEDNPRVIMLKDAGKSVGIEFKKKADKMPNTLKGHTLLRYAKQLEDGKWQNQVAEEVYKAHFTEGVFLDSSALVSIAARAGLNKAEVKAFINNEAEIEATHETAKNWSRQGVSGVPCVYMNGQRVFSGAQDTDTFVKVIEKVAEKFPLQSPASL